MSNSKFCLTTIPNEYCHYHISLFYSIKVLLLTTVLLNYLLFPAKYILETVFVAYHKWQVKQGNSWLQTKRQHDHKNCVRTSCGKSIARGSSFVEYKLAILLETTSSVMCRFPFDDCNKKSNYHVPQQYYFSSNKSCKFVTARQWNGEGNFFQSRLSVSLSVHRVGGGSQSQTYSVQEPNCTAPSPDMFKLFHCIARPVGKRVVDIRLRCLLVLG